MNKVIGDVFTQVKNNAIYVVFSCLFLITGCSDDSSQSVTVGDDVPRLDLPVEFRNANPNVRIKMTPTISYRVDSDGEFLLLSTERASDTEGGVNVVDASQLMVMDTQSYQVQVIWSYPQADEKSIDLGTVLYEVSVVQPQDGMRTASAGTVTFEMQTSNPANLNNLQLLNSLYRGDEVAIIEAILELPNSVDPETFDYIADFDDSSESIDYEIERFRWGVNLPLRIPAEPGVTGEVEADFPAVFFSAVSNDSEIYFQLNNTDPLGEPFTYPIQVLIGGEEISSAVTFTETMTEFTSDSGSAQMTFETATEYAYRLKNNRLDIRRLSMIDTSVEVVKITFFSMDMTMPVANWEGRVLFRGNSMGNTASEDVLNLEVKSEAGEENTDRVFPECTPLIISPNLNGEIDPDVVRFDYISPSEFSDFIPGTAPTNMIQDHEKNIRLPTSRDGMAYIYTVTVRATLLGQPLVDPIEDSISFQVEVGASNNENCIP